MRTILLLVEVEVDLFFLHWIAASLIGLLLLYHLHITKVASWLMIKTLDGKNMCVSKTWDAPLLIAFKVLIIGPRS